MSSDLFVFDSFFSDPLSPFAESAIDIFQAISDINHHHHSIAQNPVDDTIFSDQISSSVFFSTSPPSHQLENLSLTHLQDSSNSATQFPNFPSLGVKTEDYGYQSFGQHSYGCHENVAKLMQRSYSSHSFDGKPSLLFQPRIDRLVESENFQLQGMSSLENGFSGGPMRRVCSTGDIQKMKTTQGGNHRLSSSTPILATESSFMEEANFKVGRYSAEERKERIHRYRAKRTQRNFNKTIKYACRKTLADNRPRVRGRFARNVDDTGEIPKAAASNRYEDEDDLWIDGFNEEDEEGAVGAGGGPFYYNISGPTQFQYYGYH